MYFLLLFLSIFMNVKQAENGELLRVMSYNIRYDSKDDAAKGHGWEIRKHEIAKLIQFYQPQVMGMQEVLKNQLDDLGQLLPEYKSVGVGRDDGKEKGEYSPILYNADIFSLEESGTFWLSKNPDKPGKSWDAALPRICTWTVLTHKNTKKQLYFFNTHFDHVGVEARKESAKLILKKIREISGGNDFILTGDLNLTPETAPIKIFVAADEVNDSKEKAQLDLGPNGTFSGFEVGANQLERRIDYVFPSNSFEVENYMVLNTTYGNHYPSDHLPVLVDLGW